MLFFAKHLRVFTLFIGMLALAGCAQVPMATPEEDAKAKQFTPTAETASLYIYRDEIFGAAVPLAVTVNNQHLGQSGPKSYFHLNVAPGKYNIESVAENTAALTVDVEAAKNYFVWQEVKMGLFMARTHLTQMEETGGRTGVLASKLLAVKVPGTAIAPIGGAPAMPLRTVAPTQMTSPATPAVSTVAPPSVAVPSPAAKQGSTSAAVVVAPPAQPAPNKKESRLEWLKKMLDAKLISTSEYEVKRQQVLSAP